MNDGSFLNKTALAATLHCLTGCAIGEVAGMIVGTGLGWGNLATVIVSIVLAFIFGYSLSVLALLRAKLPVKKALTLVLAADTLSIATMELVDNAVVVVIPGALMAGLANPIFWVSLMISLFIAFWAAFPVNRYLLQQGRGHALVHEFHHNHSVDTPSEHATHRHN